MAPRDTLVHYRHKRDFNKTPEPKGIPEKESGYRYLIQKHAATRLHYDFRLELDGVLKSWAVTRGPSLDPADKRLAVEVEDHPVAYGTFEGIIPQGEYGGGTVMLWDEGSWEPVGDPRTGLAEGKLVFKLHGKRLTGEWTLVRMRGRESDKGRNNWLLIKHQDAIARAGVGDILITKNTTSIVSGRTMEKIAASKDKIWQSKTTPAKKEKSVKSKAKSKTPLPAFIPPELATLTDAMPQGKDWVHEVKFDGYRTLAYINNGEVQMFTRTGLDWTHKFISVANALETLPADTAILDGEIVVVDDKGVTSFKLLQEALTNEAHHIMHYYAFDLLYFNGEDLTKLPLLQRKARLEKILTKNPDNRLLYSEHFSGEGGKMMANACSLNLEGIISKRADSTYQSGRGKAWLKTKCTKRQEFVIVGFTQPTHQARGIGALLLGYYQNDILVYAGKCGTGFDQTTSLALRKKLDTMRVGKQPLAEVSADGRRRAHWVKPQLVCEVEFTEWTGDGHLRHPSFQGLREDKPAPTVGRDKPVPVGKATRKIVKKTSASKNPSIGGITISHPDRIIFPGTTITKQQLAEYYLSVADHILPHIESRPLSMLRCPEGIGSECFFQRHISLGQSPHLLDAEMDLKGRGESYLMIKDEKGLLTLTQWGVIELHPWGCRADKPELPDRIIFDLDPDPEVPWKHMIEGALDIRTRMEEFGLKSFLKTTGGKGLHVVLPLTRELHWPAVKAFALSIAMSMQSDQPNRYIAKASKAARKGKIFIDYLRNDLTSTAVAPFSVRARAGAAVAYPLSWEQLTLKLKPSDYTMETVTKLLAKRKSDPWADFFTVKQKLSPKILRALKIDPE